MSAFPTAGPGPDDKAQRAALWEPSYEARLAAQARAIADEVRVLSLRAQLLGLEEVELPTDLVLRAADLFERMADFPPPTEDPAA